ncbi:MAG TPA: helix-turn-helix transcriptional regulator [Candidatus Angelobacter sp.]|nr:helix-turn-helix transcriptional regulator [Candidatus Angelobacter sp.]
MDGNLKVVRTEVSLSAGKRLRELREQMGLTLRDVEISSTTLSETRSIDEFIINPSRLSDIETKGVIPSIYRLYVLSVIYRADFTELLKLYGVDLSLTAADFAICSPIKTHRLELPTDRGTARFPSKIDPGFNLRVTTDVSRMIQDWGSIPMQYLDELAHKQKYIYAYVGMEDLTMYPLLLPGSFLQVDETRTRVEEKKWRSELERPIYFIETREGYVCCWCSVRRGEIVLQSHPLSPVPARILKHPQEAEVIGQVVGVAMRLGEVRPAPAPAVQEQPQIPAVDEGEPKEVRRH